jgi:hypothetical protein
MKADGSRNRHFALALPMIEIVSRLFDIGFQDLDVRPLTHNTPFTWLEFRSHQIFFFVEHARES